MVEVGLGLLVGLVLALTGAGGGILTVPLLIFVVGLELHQAAPIGLMAVGLAAWVGAVIGLRDGIVRYKAAALMACCGVLLAPVGVWLAARVEHDVLAVVFALVMFWVAFRAFRRPPNDDSNPRAVPCRLNPQTGRFHWAFTLCSDRRRVRYPGGFSLRLAGGRRRVRAGSGAQSLQ